MALPFQKVLHQTLILLCYTSIQRETFSKRDGRKKMARIKIIETAEFVDATFRVNGEDIVDGMLNDEYYAKNDDEGEYYEMEQVEADWWMEWAKVEALVTEAWDNATEDQRERHAKLVQDYGYDLSMLHDAECELFGIER